MRKTLNIIAVITVLSCCPFLCSAFAGTLNDYNPYNVNIPDNGGKVNSDLLLSGAPSGVKITKVKVYYEIRHTYPGDLDVWLTTYYNGSWHDYYLYHHGDLGSSDDIVETKDDIHAWNGASPNQTWYLGARDRASGEVGYIDFFELWVTYSVNDSPDEPSDEDPSDGDTDVSISKNLDWSCSDPNNDTLYYTVYFEKNDSTPTDTIKTNATGSSADPGTLDYNSHYYWQVKADDQNGGVTLGSVWDFYTKSVGNLEVTVRNVGGSAVGNASVVRYNPGGGSTSGKTDGSGKIRWNNIDTGSYSLEANYTGTFFGEEYWGDANATVNADQTTYTTLNRIYPFIELVEIKDDASGVTIGPTDEIPVGTRVRLEVTVRNKVSQSLNTKVRLLFDRSQSAPYDSEQTSSTEAIGGNSTRKYTLYYTISDAGTWHRALEVKTTLLNGTTTTTDGWPWEQAFNVIDADLAASAFSHARYYKGDSASATFTISNRAGTALQDSTVHVELLDPTGASVGGVTSSPFTVGAHSSYTTPSLAIWTMPSGGTSGAYMPVVTLRDNAGNPVATYTPTADNTILPVIPMGDFPRLNSLIVRSQEHFSPSDDSDVAAVLQQIRDAGLYQLSMSVKLDDGAGKWSCLGPISGQVLFNAPHVTTSGQNPLPYNLLERAQSAAASLGMRADLWIPTFYDRAALDDHPSWELTVGPGQLQQDFVDPYLPEVRNYEIAVIVDALTAPYSQPSRITIDHFRYTYGQHASSHITAFASAVKAACPAGTQLAGYMWLPGDTWWSGQDYASLDPHLDIMSPMFYWQSGVVPNGASVPESARAWVSASLDSIVAILGSAKTAKKVAPTLSITSSGKYTGGSSYALDDRDWRRTQINVLGVLGDYGLDAYDMFYHGNWLWQVDGSKPDLGKWVDRAKYLASLGPNSAPTGLALGGATVAENEPSGSTVGALSTTDPDSADTFSYTLVSGAGSADNGSFTVAGDQLKTAGSFDYETKNSYSVRVRTTDQGGLWLEDAFTITVTDVNMAPTNMSISPSTVPENEPSGTAVGVLSTVDGEPLAGPFTYTLVSGIGAADNGSFMIAGDQLKTAASFDYETKDSYSIRVRTTDQGGLWCEETFAITVVDVAETDTDGDGLLDSLEMLMCTDPHDADSDDDGLQDGVEDANHNGQQDSDETHPCNSDTDADGIQDGTELGVTEPVADPDGDGPLLGTDIEIFQPDQDSTTTTNPLKSDSDGDGFEDGDEDKNHNGKVDPGEDDPFDPCPNDPVRVLGPPVAYFGDIQNCYDVASDGDVIEIHAIDIIEDLLFDHDISVILRPGHLCDYSGGSFGRTTIKGFVNISDGGVTIDKGCLEIGP